jgi:cell division protein FtsQ
MVIVGVRLGQNLFDIDLGEATRRLAAEPRIARVEIRRRLPSTLSVLVEDRVAVAVYAAPTGLWRMDAGGRVIEQAAGAHSLLLVTAAAGSEQVAPGEAIPAVKAAAAVAARISPTLAALLSDIHVDARGELEIKSRDGILIKFGTWLDVDEKLRVLELLLAQLATAGSRPRVVDVRVPQNPVVY